MQINSINNSKVKEWAKLNIKKYRDTENLFLVEGDHLVNEAIKNHIAKEIIVLEGTKFNSNIPTYEVTPTVMRKITNQASISNICAICQKLEEKEVSGNVIILDEIQDPGNLGTIIRSAVAFGFGTIVLGNTCVDLYNDKTIRASEGMIFNINIIRKDLQSFIPLLKEKNYQVFGTNVKNGLDIKDIEITGNIAIVLGNEGNGIKKEIASMCDKNIYIKMQDNCESLNVGVAASILMYEISNKERL